ncbi:helix-turn-helix transcriptional regulator [Rhodococcus rhodnii]|uniref:helix-turn-helix transcriptional regulator n=1 Tax=Rhodococcus rhodnii TaxID=38312 RepID=UPI001160DA65|nr:helix-turn-helix transcriptional regulator [Rhodococcus rhodnii]
MSKLSDLLNSQPVSARQAADIAKEKGIRLPYGTIAAYWSGRHGRPSAQTLERLAEVLSTPLAQLQRAAWDATAPLGPYEPPAEANLLSRRERNAVDELIRAMAEAITRGQDRADSSTEEVTQPRPEASGTVDSSPSGGDRPRRSPPMNDGKVTALPSRDQAPEPDERPQRLAARHVKGGSREKQRRRAETAPEDQSQGEGPEGGA